MQNDYYCQKHQGSVCFKENGKLIGIVSCKKPMGEHEVCKTCFTEQKQGANL